MRVSTEYIFVFLKIFTIILIMGVIAPKGLQLLLFYIENRVVHKNSLQVVKYIDDSKGLFYIFINYIKLYFN